MRFRSGIQATEGGFEIAFSIDQEIRGDDHLVVFSESFLDLDAASATPSELGFATAPVETMRGGGPEQNARMAKEVLDGAPGPRRDVVLLNAAAALRAAGLAKDWKDGIRAGREAIDSGRAGDVLQRWAKISQE